MKKIAAIMFFALAFCAADCKRETINCHLSFKVFNKTNRDIVVLTGPSNDTTASCNLPRFRVPALTDYKFRLQSTCWEDELSIRPIQLFFFDASGEAGKPFPDCDSLILNDQLLERRHIYVSTLQNSNWVVEFK